jgi:predicted O-methyltransferase YrrM
MKYADEFIPDADELYACKRRIYPAFVDYVQHVSPKRMAMSLSSCTYILWLAEQIKPRSAVDFGSGLTSYVLRLACDNVYSVDDSPEWLGNTRRFLKRYRADNDQLFLLDEYKEQEHSHDLVVYDFSCGDMRDNNFAYAIGQLTASGVGVMDDANHAGHQQSMLDACDMHGRELLSLKTWTLDEYGRYAALVR